MSSKEYNGVSEQDLDRLVSELDCVNIDLDRFNKKKDEITKTLDAAKKKGYKTYEERWKEENMTDEDLVAKKKAKKSVEE